MMNNFPLIHTVRTAYSVDGAVLCTIYVHNSRFAGFPLLMFKFAVIPPFFTGVHTLIPQLMNMALLTERSDRCLQTLWAENVLSVSGMVRTTVAGPAPFSSFFAVFYIVRNV